MSHCCDSRCNEGRRCPRRQRMERAAVGIWLALVWAVCTLLAKWLGAPITFL